MYNFNMVFMAMLLLTWGCILFFAIGIYKKQPDKPKIWKAIVILCVGFFTFSINFEMLGTLVKFPILPLGVWILAWFFKEKEERWNVYRLYAWLGFYANFIFLIVALITNPVHDVIYPKDDPTTFIKNVDNAVLYNLHPSANESLLNKDELLNQLPSMDNETIYSGEWYNDIYFSSDTNNKKERFPYQLVGTNSKWGSGLHSLIYVEEDGKGLLITTSKGQYYFRSTVSFIERGGQVE